MDNVTDIFDQDVAGSGDLDTDLVNASHLLQKMAEESGVDLSELSAEDIADMVRDIMPGHEQEQTQEAGPSGKEAAMDQEETGLTYQDVAFELSKRASAAGIDLTQVSREEYNEAFSKIAEEMSDPETVQAKIAEEQKLAEAYAHGERMADGFLDRLKQAEEENKAKPEDEDDKKKKDEEEKKASLKDRAVGMASKALGKGDRAVQRTGAKLLNVIGAGAEAGSPSLKRRVGGAALGAGALGAGGAGAAVHHGRKKESELEDAALKVAAEVAAELGYDLATGQPLQKVAGASEEELVTQRAFEILKEAGYPV